MNTLTVLVLAAPLFLGAFVLTAFAAYAVYPLLSDESEPDERLSKIAHPLE